MLHVRAAARSVLAACLAAPCFVSAVALAQTSQAGQMPGGMPDARMMSGIPMPAGDVPDGTISVRLVRGEISNILPKQPVELVVDGKTRTAKTDDTGRAQFSGVAAGANAQAVATVDGERIESQRFAMPEKGGVRLMLVASGAGTAAGTAQPDAAPVPGAVTFGGDSRIVIEFDDDTLSVFYLLDVINNGRAPVNPSTPVVFDLPEDAMGASLLEGSSPQAQVKGGRVSIAGPFKPGRTTVQIGYQLPPLGDARRLVQQFPAAFDAMSIAVQKAGNVQVKSAQLAQQQDVPADGKAYVLGSGPALPARRPLTIELSGLPHHETWPRNVSLLIALAILGAGLWSGLGRSQSGVAARRRELEGRRDRLFAELVRLEQAKRAGTIDTDTYGERRADLMTTLERIYGELDGAALSGASDMGTPGGGDRGLAA